MKDLRICLEVNGLAEDENGAPCAGGISVRLGEVPESEYEEKTKLIYSSVKISGILKLACLDKLFKESDCRLISPEEYDELYGDEED